MGTWPTSSVPARPVAAAHANGPTLSVPAGLVAVVHANGPTTAVPARPGAVVNGEQLALSVGTATVMPR